MLNWLKRLFLCPASDDIFALTDFLRDQNVPLLRFNDVCRLRAKRFCVILHRVNKLNKAQVRIAKSEYLHGVKASYFVRICDHRIDKAKLSLLKNYEHEVGYYYENISYVTKTYKCSSYHEMINKAHLNFENNITKLREAIPVFFILAYNPDPNIDNRELWKHFTIKEVGVRADIERDSRFHEVLWFKKEKHGLKQFYIDNSGTAIESGNYYSSFRELLSAFKEHEIPDRIILDF